MKDLIDRQAAIDALGEKPLAWTEGEYELGLQNQWQSDVDALNGLPSAQPQDVVDKNKLVETIKHYMQYPDGLNRLLAIYGGN